MQEQQLYTTDLFDFLNSDVDHTLNVENAS